MNAEWAKLWITPFSYVAAIFFAIFLIWLFRRRLNLLIKYLGVSSLKIAGVEISLSSAEIDHAQKKAFSDRRIENYDKKESQELADLASFAAPYITGSRLLWVDDNPFYNIEERRAFRLLGIEVVNRLNTAEAIDALCLDDYDLVISDISREYFPSSSPCAESEVIQKARLDGDSGWKTLSEIKRIHRIPVLFYHGSSYQEAEERDHLAIKEGAVGATPSPATLYRWVLSTLLMKVLLKDEKLRHLIIAIPGELRQRLSSSNKNE